jgi:hypothetical protein
LVLRPRLNQRSSRSDPSQGVFRSCTTYCSGLGAKLHSPNQRGCKFAQAPVCLCGPSGRGQRTIRWYQILWAGIVCFCSNVLRTIRGFSLDNNDSEVADRPTLDSRQSAHVIVVCSGLGCVKLPGLGSSGLAFF